MAGVNKVLYSILYFLRQEIGTDYQINPDLSMLEILKEEGFDELDFILALIHFEMNHGVEIPDKLLEQKNLSLREFASQVAELEPVPDEEIPGFYITKTSLISYLITTVKNSQWQHSDDEIPN
ncbi:MAG: hypothetical protein IT279_07955 [Ignavibacteriaceae bacterium]|nr:hypothetical protein [Ignavibacteriaceae bacterium]